MCLDQQEELGEPLFLRLESLVNCPDFLKKGSEITVKLKVTPIEGKKLRNYRFCCWTSDICNLYLQLYTGDDSEDAETLFCLSPKYSFSQEMVPWMPDYEAEFCSAVDCSKRFTSIIRKVTSNAKSAS